ncbi:MAG: hypothetical protein E7812_03900 [Phenylobacterium sp.]|nr:MAG: hypothetical protein E7812_03900 [Phenylobacterium sp.]
MTLTDLASIGALINGLAVLASLVYLNLQTRQTARNQQSLMQHGRATQLIDWLQYIAREDIQGVMLGGNDGDLNVTDYVRYNSVLWSGLIAYENNFIQHRARMLDDDQYAATLGALRFQCSLPGFRAMWRQLRNTFDAEFKAYVDDLIAQTPVRPHASATGHAAWRARAAEETAKAKPASAAG